VFKNKLDEFETVIGKKARLMVQVYNHEKGINYEEAFLQGSKLFAFWYLLQPTWRSSYSKWMSKVHSGTDTLTKRFM